MAVEFLNVDCMAYMATLPDKIFDLAVVDPPYGIGKTWGKSSCPDYAKRDKYENKKWNDITPTDKYFTELYRVSHNQIIWGCNYYSANIKDVGRIVWDKKTVQDKTSGCDLASQSFSRRIDIFRFMWDGYRQEVPEDRIHPTQKPVALYKWLLKKYAKPGDRILDTHGGSMSSAIAAEHMGFDMTICELDKDYFDAGVKRFKEQTMQIKIF